ncbi:MAG: sigma-70 family RNA polymerase sigma factor [Planctomycetota bacterium]
MSRTEASLVQDVIRGDTAAFAELYRLRCRLVIAYCQDSARDSSEAADLAQEVFMRAYRSLDRLRDPSRFGSWLIGIARRVCREARRRGDREQRRLAGAVEQAADITGRELSADSDTLRVAIAALPESERIALHAFYLEERRIEAVAELLRISRASAYRLLARARERLRSMLSSEEALS